MGHPFEELTFGVPVRSPDTKLYTAYPQGQASTIVVATGGGATGTSVAPAGSAASLDNGDLFADGLSGDIVAGELVTLVPITGDNAFGNTGPDVCFWGTYEGDTPDQRCLAANIEGNGTHSVPAQGPWCIAHPDLPFGRGIVVARDSYAVTAPQFECALAPRNVRETYEIRTYYFPIVDYSAAENAGQLKSLWWTRDRGWTGTEGRPDLFFGGHYEFNNGSIFTGNSMSAVDDTSNPGLKVSTNVWRANRNLRMSAWMRGYGDTGAASGNGGHYALVDEDNGIIVDKTWNNDVVWWPGDSVPGFNMFSFPGFVDNTWLRTTHPQYQSETYVAVGAGAPARIEICDTQIYSQRRRAVTWPVFIQSNWTNTSIICRVEKGIFYLESLAGKYIHIFDANDTHIHGGVGRLIQST